MTDILNEIDPNDQEDAVILDDRWVAAGGAVRLAMSIAGFLVIVILVWQNTLYLDRLDDVVATACKPVSVEKGSK